MWRELIQGLTTDCEFFEPASDERLDAVEKTLKTRLPSELRQLLKESNGIYGEYKLSLVWSAERIEADNVEFRTFSDFKELYMPFDCLLFFADAGNGDQFAYTIRSGEVRNPDIYAWNHENDSRVWIAPSLEKYFEWWLSGKVQI